MTTINNLFTETTPVNTVFSDDIFTFDVSEINAEITALNTELSTSYAILDNVTDNFERFLHLLLIFSKLREINNNDTGFGIKIGTVQAGTGIWNTVYKNQKTFPITFPFSSDIDVYGDSNNIG